MGKGYSSWRSRSRKGQLPMCHHAWRYAGHGMMVCSACMAQRMAEEYEKPTDWETEVMELPIRHDNEDGDV